MQNKYAGDVADYGKFGLLRFLSGLTDPDTPEPDLRLAVAWWFHLDKCERRDGQVIGYLKDTKKNRRIFRDCDPCLWHSLRELVDGGRRCVHCIEAAELLPKGTLYHRELLHFPKYLSKPGQRLMREEIRRLWIRAALRATRDADLVYLDPDTGASEDNRRYQAVGPKWAYPEEILAFWESGQSLVIYQDLGMNVNADTLALEAANRICRILGERPITLRYLHGPARVFLVVPNPKRPDVAERVRERTFRFLDGCWGQYGHFRPVGQEGEQ